MDPQRKTVNYFVVHHAVTPLWQEKSKAELADWFSNTGFTRGYGGKASNWSGLINPFTGNRSYAQAHLVGQRVDGSTPDATAEERALGYRVFPIVQDIWGQITWGAGNWEVNRAAINIENLGDYRNYEFPEGACIALANFWREHDRSLNGATQIVGHKEVSQTGTACPTRIMEKRDHIVDLVNSNPIPTPEPPSLDIKWSPYPAPKAFVTNKQPTNLWDFAKTNWNQFGDPIKQFDLGERMDIAGEAFNVELGSTYLLTPYSFQRKITNGFNKADLSEYVEPTPEPEPEPTPDPEPEPQPEPTPEPGFSDEIAKFFVSLYNWLKTWFGGGK